ncbi:MAG: DUF4412 domain-containing protein [Chitinophagales bacterium]
MKTIFSIALIAISLGASAFDGTIKQQVKNYNGSGNTFDYTWYFSSKGLRFDLEFNGKDGKTNTVFLTDALVSKIQMYTIDGKASEKHIFDIETSKASADVQIITSRATGEKKVISGYNCEKYEIVTNTTKIESWITKDIAVDWTNYQNLFRNSPEVLMMAREGIKGFSLESNSANGQNAISLTKVIAGSPAESVFSIPAGYTPFYTNNK